MHKPKDFENFSAESIIASDITADGRKQIWMQTVIYPEVSTIFYVKLISFDGKTNPTIVKDFEDRDEAIEFYNNQH